MDAFSILDNVTQAQADGMAAVLLREEEEAAAAAALKAERKRAQRQRRRRQGKGKQAGVGDVQGAEGEEEEEDDDDDDEPPYDFLCPISFDLLLDPVRAADGHSYGRQSLEQHIEWCIDREYDRWWLGFRH